MSKSTEYELAELEVEYQRLLAEQRALQLRPPPGPAIVSEVAELEPLLPPLSPEAETKIFDDFAAAAQDESNFHAPTTAEEDAETAAFQQKMATITEFEAMAGDARRKLAHDMSLDLLTASELAQRAKDLEVERERLAAAIQGNRMGPEVGDLVALHDAVVAQLKLIADLRVIPLTSRVREHNEAGGQGHTPQATVVNFEKKAKRDRRRRLTPEERSEANRIGGRARMAKLSERQKTLLGRKGHNAACAVVSWETAEPDYTPPPTSERWTPEVQARMAAAGYMELRPALGPGFRCGSCRFGKGNGGPPSASGDCSNPRVLAAVSATHGCCNHYLPDEALGEPVVGGGWEPERCVEGYRGAACGEVITPTGKERACYAVVPLSSLVTSHNPETWQVDPMYPIQVQERDYTKDREEQAKVGRIAKAPDPRLLLADNPTAVDGPPVVTGSGIVLGGNGRTMGLKLAYSLGTAGPYVEQLEKQAPKFGLDADQVRSLDRPVLVRVVQGLDTATQAQLADASSRFNEGLTGSLDERAKGVADSRRLSAETLALLAGSIERHETLRKAMAEDGRAIVAALRNDGLITPQNSSAMVNSVGGLTEAGKARVEGAFLGLAAGTPDRLAQASAATVQKLERLVPYLAAVRAVNPAADAIPTFQAALDLLHSAEAAGMTIDEFIAQGALFA